MNNTFAWVPWITFALTVVFKCARRDSFMFIFENYVNFEIMYF